MIKFPDLYIKNSKTLIELLRMRSEKQPHRKAFTFLKDGENCEVSINYSELDFKARQIAYKLNENCRINDRVMLLFQPGLDFIAAFFGCLYAGVIAVPAYPPRPRRSDQRLNTIIKNSRSKTALTTTEVVKNIQTIINKTGELSEIQLINIDEINNYNNFIFPERNEKNIAFLQYTSGSTSLPKGVKITHGNLMQNLKLIYKCFGHSSESTGVIWLPPYHDMGLIGGILQPLFAGFHVILMSPASFLHSPIRWLKAVSKYKGTTSGGPNFAYDLCVKKITSEQKTELNLESWDVAFNGAEPISAETMYKFAAAFKSCGFKKEAFYPCYGLAESTLIVSGGKKTALPYIQRFDKDELKKNNIIKSSFRNKNNRMLVGNGQFMDGHKICIVNPDTLYKCQNGQIGEIWISGPSVADGYWEMPDESKKSFEAYINGIDEGPFFRTGDLGFILENELFVTGRIKDLIIIRGRNHYPQDIENTAMESHSALQSNGGAAFSVNIDNNEVLVIVHELSRQGRHMDIEEIVNAVRQEVTKEHEVQVYAVVLLKPGYLPRTSSGKVRRNFCRKAFLENSLNVIESSILDKKSEKSIQKKENLNRKILLSLPENERADKLETFLHDHCEKALKTTIEKKDLNVPLISLGLDSLTAIELQGFIENEFKITCSLEDILGELSIDLLIKYILKQILTDSKIPSITSKFEIKKADRTQDIPLSVDQELLWIIDQVTPGNASYNLPAGARIKGELNIDKFENCINKLINRHESLRIFFAIDNGRAVQVIKENLKLKLPIVDLSKLASSEKIEKYNLIVSNEISTPFNLSISPLFRILLIKFDDNEHRFLITLHHTICDLWSIYIFYNELKELYKNYDNQDDFLLPELKIQYADFAVSQRKWLQNNGGEKELLFWKKKMSGANPLLELPTDYRRPDIQTFEGTSYTFSLPEKINKSIHEFSKVQGVTVYMTLLTAFFITLNKYSNQEDLIIGAPIAGRTKELENLIGFFAFPVLLRLQILENPTFQQILKDVRNIVLETYEHPVPFAKLLQGLSPKRNKKYHPLYQVSFGYFNKTFNDSEKSEIKFDLMDVGKETTDFDLFMTLYNGQDEIKGVLEYSTNLFKPGTIDELINLYYNVLEIIIDYPRKHLSDLSIQENLESKIKASIVRDQIQKFAVSATFTAEPLDDPLSFWIKKLGWNSKVEFAPYNQLFQQLVDPDSLLSRNNYGLNIVLLRFEDWFRYSESSNIEIIKTNTNELINYLKTAVLRASVPYLVFICPASPGSVLNEETSKHFQEMELFLENELKKISGIYPVTSKEISSTYPVKDYYNIYTDKEGHVPYTPVFFTALAMMSARKIYSLQNKPKKVIVLDCDQTLWKGVCGEDGASGIKIDLPRKKLQEFMIEQKNMGRLLCLCSKNNESDVWEVFDYQKNMPLKKEHLVAWKINWNKKSDNINELAKELNLGLDSFIFVDDNPVECADVKANCPGVDALLLPSDSEKIPSFLKHVWAFDQLKITEEDQKRTLLYQQNFKREQFKKNTVTINDFLKGLGIKIDIKRIKEDKIGRVAQLTQRTNQFNLTTVRRDENKIKELHENGNLECLTVDVQDRFGDYGLVGVMLYKKQSDVLLIDTFLLSCRSMGRGVEHEMLSYLGKLAEEKGLKKVEVPYYPTSKNQPALDFLNTVGSKYRNSINDGYIFRFPAKEASQISLN